MTPTVHPVIRFKGEGDARSGLGITIVQKIHASETDGVYSVMEYTAPPQFIGMIPQHSHQKMTEVFYILHGEIIFQLKGERIVAGTGTLISVPPGVEHSFFNESAKPAGFLIFSLYPAGKNTKY